MKKLIVLIWICATGIIACGKKMIPETGSGSSSNMANEKEAKEEKTSRRSGNTNTSSANTPSFNDMKQSQTDISVPQDPAYLELGKNVFLTKCGTCHALKKISDYSSSRWTGILKTEIPRAKLSSAEGDQVKAFILAKASK